MCHAVICWANTLLGELEAQIKAWHRSSELSWKLEKIPGIDP
jgi:hypothetical protein